MTRIIIILWDETKGFGSETSRHSAANRAKRFAVKVLKRHMKSLATKIETNMETAREDHREEKKEEEEKEKEEKLKPLVAVRFLENILPTRP